MVTAMKTICLQFKNFPFWNMLVAVVMCFTKKVNAFHFWLNSLISTKQILKTIIWQILNFPMRVADIYLAMFSPHVHHKELPGTEEAIAVFTCVSWTGRALQVFWTVTVIFLYWQSWRFLFSLVLTVDISTIFVIITGALAVGAVRISGLRAQWKVDPQVWRALRGLQGSMYGLKMSHVGKKCKKSTVWHF